MSTAVRADLLQLARAVLEAVPEGAAEAVVTEQDMGLTRFAKNRIHQNVAYGGTEIRLRLQRDGRTGVATVPAHAPDAIATVVRRAEQLRALSPPAEPSPLPGPQPDGVAEAWSEQTATATPEFRAERVMQVCIEGERHRVDTFGAFHTEAEHVAVANTSGLQRTARRTSSRAVVVARGEDGAGYGERGAVHAGDVDVAAAGAEAVQTCLRNQGAEAIDPGDYEVVLTPYAMGELLVYLSWIGLGALAKQEQRSFLRPGEQQAAASVTIRDDTAQVLPIAFDAEGVTRRAVTILDAGVGGGWVYDTPTALRDGVESTGHALPLPNTQGPMARQLVMEPGDAGGVDELVSRMQRGLLVTRFWYIRIVHPLRTVVTGMTREGTFLVERGKVVRPVRDLRFTQSIIDALAQVRGLSRERLLTGETEGLAALAPAAHIGRFSFTS